MSFHRLTWPVACVTLSALAIFLVLFDANTVVRAPVVLTFLLICPGLAIVRFLRISDVATEWSIAVALSFSLDGLVALIQAYTTTWNPTTALLVLTGITLAAIAIDLLLHRRPEDGEQP